MSCAIHSHGALLDTASAFDREAHGICLSCSRTISHRAKEPRPTPQGPMEGRQKGEPCCCCRGGSQGSHKGGGDDLAVAGARCFVVARYLYHAFKVAIERFFQRINAGMNRGTMRSHGSGRARSVRAQLAVGSKPIQAECKTHPN